MRRLGRAAVIAVAIVASVEASEAAGLPDRGSDAARGADPPVTQALTLLAGECVHLPPDLPIAPVRLPAEISHVIVRVDAWTDGQKIWVNVLSPEYRRAVRGDGLALAAILAHENYHVAHGPAEAPAYAEQVRVLRLLGAPARQTAVIERARRYATSGNR